MGGGALLWLENQSLLEMAGWPLTLVGTGLIPETQEPAQK